jgi:uncharacterized repeat protein (TIGR02543 family)
MKRIISFVVLFLIIAAFMYLNGQWARTFGGSNHERAYSIRQTSDGGYIVAGYTESFGAGDADFWLLKLSSTGAIEGEMAFGGSSLDKAYCILETDDGGAVAAGDTESFGAGGADIWIIKFDSDSAIEEEGTIGGSSYDFIYSLQPTSDGGAIIAAETYSFGAGESDIWLLKASSTGDIEGQATFGGSSYDWPSFIQETSDGGCIASGSTYSFGAGGADIWIIKLSSTGVIEAQATLGGSEDDWSSSVLETDDGGCVVFGNTQSFGTGGVDIWVLKFDSDGNIEEQATFGGSEDDLSLFVSPTSDGGCIVAGYTESFGAGGKDIWLLKTSSTADIEWQKTYGGTEDEVAYSVQQTSDGGYIVAGYSTSFGAGEENLLVMKLDSDGDIDPSCTFIGSSDGTTTTTYVSAEDTYIDPEDTFVTAEETDCDVEDTYAETYQICPRYTLTISATAGGTTSPSPGSHTYEPGEDATVTATANSGYQFSGWSGDASGATTSITITMDSDKSITANFTATGDGDGDGEKKGCFIATAAYGSPLHRNLDILRDFREKYLMPSRVGRALVDIYYKYSPFMASIIAKHRTLKIAVRISLLPFVAFSYSMVHFGPIASAVMLAFVLALPIFFIWFYPGKLRILKLKFKKGEK